MSYNIIDKLTTSLIEGVELLQAKYPFYNIDRLKDDESGKVYSVQMIENSLNYLEEMNRILKMMIFDCLIGNSDRHHSNWAEISTMDYDSDKRVFIFHWDICPLYDNGSSLCAYVNNNDIEIFFKDKMRFESLVNTKSKSMIGWKDKRPIRHFDLLIKLKENYYETTLPYIKCIKDNINKENIEKLLKKFDNDIITPNMKKLLKKYLLERRKRMLEIYNLGDE